MIWVRLDFDRVSPEGQWWETIVLVETTAGVQWAYLIRGRIAILSWNSEHGTVMKR